MHLTTASCGRHSLRIATLYALADDATQPHPQPEPQAAAPPADQTPSPEHESAFATPEAQRVQRLLHEMLSGDHDCERSARQTAAARSAPRCTHIKTNGVRCGSPALAAERFCYFHHRARTARELPEMPLLEDAASIQLALMQVIRALTTGATDPKTAALLFYALQTASANLKYLRLEFASAEDRERRLPRRRRSPRHQRERRRSK